ncbi:unnamed protein product, partial [Closterium sp. Naga37s-1]
CHGVQRASDPGDGSEGFQCVRQPWSRGSRLAEAFQYTHRRQILPPVVEIVDNARPIQSHPFTGNTAFLLGNEHGPGTASLNVIVAASIVLHHFA